MTLTLFIVLVTILSLCSSLISEAIKKTYNIIKSTLIAAVVSIIVGGVVD